MNDLRASELDVEDVAVSAAVVHEKITDGFTPGYQVEFTPEEADSAGAFVEDALSELDAVESSIDLPLANAAVAANDGE